MSTITKLESIRRERIAKDGYASFGYGDLVRAVGLEIVSTDDFGYYQGDFLFHVTDADGRHGLLIQGYGSCSGCDSLEAAQTWDDNDNSDLPDVAALADGMLANIVWAGEDGLRAAFEAKISQKENNWWAYSDDELLTRARAIADEVDAG